METLTSLKNPKVALWRSLRERRARKENGLFFVEGRKMVAEALHSRFATEAVLCDEEHRDEFAGLLDQAPQVYLLPEHVLAAVCDTKTPQGIAAVLRLPTDEQETRSRRLVALDDVQDPGNVGTILRTADAAGFDGVLLSDACADPFSPKVLRATMGSIFRMKVQTVRLAETLGGLREQGYAVLSSQLDGQPFYDAVKTIGAPFVLIVGNEGNGVSEAVAATATHHVKLPMRGGAESLNAAVAAAIMMYELTRELGE